MAGTILLLLSQRKISLPQVLSNVTLVDQSTLDGLPTKNASAAFTERIDPSIIPPTNSWISGMVLQKTPLPVYSMPLSFLAKDEGFEVGLPRVQSAATVISGQHTPGIPTTIEGSTKFSLTRFDKISATLTYATDSEKLGTLTIAEGSPFVFYRSSNDSTLKVNGLGKIIGNSSDTYLRYTKDGRDYVMAAYNGAKIEQSSGVAMMSVPKNGLVTFYSLPNSEDDALKEFAENELQSVATTNSIDTNGDTLTTFEFKTAGNKNTVFVPMTYARLTTNTTPLTTYESVYGPMKAVQGTTFSLAAKTMKPSNTLNVSNLTDEHKRTVIAQLKTDVEKTAITANDSYFAGKQLARAATLLDLSEQLGQTETSTRLKSLLNEAFSKRLDSTYFYYDTSLKGVSAQSKAFGSEDFNDHHFHYGYFIYAASILGKYDKDFLKISEKKVNLLVADIASYSLTADFPVERNYDPYAGHSWAAGLSPFADGNNQESSSEAINAWNGVALWADLTGNTQLSDRSRWMLSNEAATAKAAWRTVDTSATYLKKYTSPLTSLSFGGKRTYATFFSDEANTKLAIQLIPMSPMMLQYVSDGLLIESVTKASITADNYNVALGDYILMYKALSDPQKAAQLLEKQNERFIDDGNSRAYLTAWVYSLTDR